MHDRNRKTLHFHGLDMAPGSEWPRVYAESEESGEPAPAWLGIGVCFAGLVMVSIAAWALWLVWVWVK